MEDITIYIHSTPIGWWNGKMHIHDLFHKRVKLFCATSLFEKKNASTWVFVYFLPFIRTINKNRTVCIKDHGCLIIFIGLNLIDTKLIELDVFFFILHRNRFVHKQWTQFYWLRSFKQLNCIKCTSSMWCEQNAKMVFHASITPSKCQRNKSIRSILNSIWPQAIWKIVST